MCVAEAQQKIVAARYFAPALEFRDTTFRRSSDDSILPDVFKLKIVLGRELVKDVGSIPPIVPIGVHSLRPVDTSCVLQRISDPCITRHHDLWCITRDPRGFTI